MLNNAYRLSKEQLKDVKRVYYACITQIAYSLHENYGNILDLEPSVRFVPSYCDKYLWQCFRDPAVYYHSVEQLRCFNNDIAGGQIGPAFGRIFDKNNAAAAKAWMGMMKDGFYA